MVWVRVLVVCACTNYNQLSTVVMVRVNDTGFSQLCALICRLLLLYPINIISQ